MVKYIKSNSFQMKYYDPCISNKIIEGDQINLV